ncbi:tyrosine-type recombinase/integrase [Micromonospora aurantiaca (nom. illeg.)]|uniref:tyrosine-type recombinase/integrase n=1 Tax=Micromonospora aurantiaca (nom. illeg.) TaxID=47850 RepID=UPI0033FB75C2
MVGVDLDQGTLRVQQTVQRVAGTLHVLDAKTEDSEAVLPLPEVTWLSLMEHQERQQVERAGLAEVWEDHDLVFPSERGTPMEPTNLSRSFARLRETAGLPGVRLHDLRHTVVSLLMELGVPPHVVQAIARHADVKVTLKVYAHASIDAMRQALGKLDGRLS